MERNGMDIADVSNQAPWCFHMPNLFTFLQDRNVVRLTAGEEAMERSDFAKATYCADAMLS